MGVGDVLDMARPPPGSDAEDVLFAVLGLSVDAVPGALQSLGGVSLGSIGAITWSDAARFADVVAEYDAIGVDELIVPDFTLGGRKQKMETLATFIKDVAGR